MASGVLLHPSVRERDMTGLPASLWTGIVDDGSGSSGTKTTCRMMPSVTDTGTETPARGPNRIDDHTAVSVSYHLLDRPRDMYGRES